MTTRITPINDVGESVIVDLPVVLVDGRWLVRLRLQNGEPEMHKIFPTREAALAGRQSVIDHALELANVFKCAVHVVEES